MPNRPPVHKAYRVKVPQHNARGNEATNRQTRRALHTGSKAWRLQRQRVLIRDLFTCQACKGYGDQVDHMNGNAEVMVGDEELQTLCGPCHSRATALHDGGFGNTMNKARR